MTDAVRDCKHANKDWSNHGGRWTCRDCGATQGVLDDIKYPTDAVRHVHCYICGAPIVCDKSHFEFVRKAALDENRSVREVCDECSGRKTSPPRTITVVHHD